MNYRHMFLEDISKNSYHSIPASGAFNHVDDLGQPQAVNNSVSCLAFRNASASASNKNQTFRHPLQSLNASLSWFKSHALFLGEQG